MADVSNNGFLTYYQAAGNQSSLTPGVWNVNNAKRHAFSVSDDFNAGQPDSISPPTPESVSTLTTKFSTLSTDLNQTQIISNGDGTERIGLDLPDRVVTLLMDQSGSMTWNDSEGLRHVISRRMINRIRSTYPGDVDFNVVQFKGLPVNVILFGVLEDATLEGNDAQSISAGFFEDEENNFAGFRLVRKEGSFPDHALDGEIVQEGFFTKAIDEGLETGQTYYYKLFTYDKNFHFSDGIPISIAPQEREIPRGVQRVIPSVLLGSGVARDGSTKALWHFDEDRDGVAYDFADEQNHMLSDEDEPVWLSSDEVPIGVSGVRFDGVDSGFETTSNSLATKLTSGTGKITLMFWVYPYDLTANRMIVSRASGGSYNWAAWHTSTGAVRFQWSGSGSLETAASALTANQWNHVAVTLDLSNSANGKIYINGNEASVTPSASATTDDGDMKVSIGKAVGALAPVAFFGKATEVSVHDSVREASYISDLADADLSTENPDQAFSGEATPDNGDRLVLVTYSIPSDTNYQSVKFVRKEIEEPSWIGDGSLRATAEPSIGTHVFTDVDDFVLGEKYNYRIFTENNIGNVSYQDDSPLINIDMPNMDSTDDLEPVSPALFSASSVTAQAGNRKVYLKWSNPTLDDRVKRVDVYASTSKFPVIDEDGSDAEIIFTGTIDDEKFVHRDIDNDISVFYTIVTRDRFGRLSTPVNIASTPGPIEDETGIPLIEGENIRSEIVNNESVSIIWDSPVEFESNLKGFLDQRVVIYAAITDEFGAPISDDSAITMNIVPQISTQNLEDEVFGDRQGVPETIIADDVYQFGVTQDGPGIVRGTLRVDNDPLVISRISKARFEISVVSTVPDVDNPSQNRFEFRSTPITVELTNPWSMELLNRDDRSVERECPKSLSGLSFSTALGDSDLAYQNVSFDGAWVRATDPFVVRANLSFREESIPEGTSVRVEVWDASDSVCSDKFRPSPIRKSTTVLPLSTVVPVQTELVEAVDEQNEGTGEFVRTSFADIPVSVPSQPQGALLYVQAEFGGYIAAQSFFILMENTLNIEVSARAPISNGKDIAEQSATVWIRDPDFPNNTGRRTTVPDGTAVKWNRKVGLFGNNARPFYSTESATTSGVVSFVRNGVAQNVFFGPASGVVWHTYVTRNSVELIGERYDISASIIWDGLSDSDEKEVEIFPVGGGKNPFGSRFLMEFPSFRNDVWADGEDFVKLIISRDANNPASGSGSCFQSCALGAGADLLEISPGQLVQLFADENTEIIWGDVEESIDPYTGLTVLELGENSSSSSGNAYVEIEDAQATFVYFRYNAFLGDQDLGEREECRSILSILTGASSVNPCGCLGLNEDCPEPGEVEVSGSATILLNNTVRNLRGGGSTRNGVPPTLLLPREPLAMRIAGTQVDGVASDTFVIDGETENDVVVEVSFSGRPVPDGTPVRVDIASALEGGLPLIDLENSVIYTETKIDSSIDPINERSYATVTVKPVTAEEGLFEQLIFTTNYDKTGLVEREKQTCITIEWEPEPEDEDISTDTFEEVSSIFNRTLYSYNVSSDAWSSTLSPMTFARGHLSFEAYSGFLYAFGGVTSKTISQDAEKYDLSTDEWETVESMPTPRFASQSVEVDGKIYVIGGISSSEFSENLQTSFAAEVYDTTTDQWSILADMPGADGTTINNRTYGVAFGRAVHVNVGGDDRIYIIGGISQVTASGSIRLLNDRVLYYDIDSNTWTVVAAFDETDTVLYGRISPSTFVDGTDIIVLGGAAPKDVQDGESSLQFFVDSFKFSTTSETVEENDQDFGEFPKARYASADVSVGTDHYFIGGSNASSLTLKSVQAVDSTASPYNLSGLASIPNAGTGLGAATTTIASAPYSSNDYIFVAGGFQSGRQPGFLQIQSSSSPSSIRLDGKQTGAINVSLKDDAGNPPESEVRISVRGFLKFSEGDTSVSQSAEDVAQAIADQQSDDSQRASAENLDERTAIYPVLFSQNETVTNNGEATITLLPRSDDVLEGIASLADRLGVSTKSLTDQITSASSDAAAASESQSDGSSQIVIESGTKRSPYSILVQITILDDFYYGQSIEDLSSLLDNPNQVDEELENLLNELDDTQSTTTEEPAPASGGGSSLCSGGATISGGISWTQSSSGIDLTQTSIGSIGETTGNFTNEQSALSFAPIPQPLGQLSSPTFGYFSDIDWIPVVETVLSGNDGTFEEALDAISNLENEIPFGASALFDSLIKVSQTLSDNDIEDKGKVIYVFTDNESSMSKFTLDEAVQEVNAIEGVGETPIVVGNFAVVDPITISSKANLTDTNDLNQLVQETAGQSISVLSSEFLDDIVGIFYGSAVGSMGYGDAVVTIDLGEVTGINQISLLAELFENTNSQWSVEISSDGFVYTPIKETYQANQDVEFSDVQARYVRVTATLVTGFSASDSPEYELVPLPGSPSITEIDVFSDGAQTSYLFLTDECGGLDTVQQVAVGVDASKVDPADIQVGISKSSSSNWSDYQNPAQLSVDQFGKIFVPIRFNEDDTTVSRESLEKVDKYTYKTHFGRWDPTSVVTIYDSDDNVILATDYKTYPRDGLVVFNRRRRGTFTIDVVNNQCFRVGIKMTNRSSTIPIDVYGIGFFYNTNTQLLPPAQRIKPEARNVFLLPDEPDPYATITASYEFKDVNEDAEDTSQLEIRWFINGARSYFLDNRLSWNNIEDATDPVWSNAFSFSSDEFTERSDIITQARTKGESLISPGDEIYFTIRVNDGNLFSDLVRSDVIEVGEFPPEISAVAIRGLTPSGAITTRISAESDAFVQYVILSDTGEDRSSITWTVNGEVFKTGVVGEDENADRILAGETNAIGEIAISLGNEISATIEPETGDASGASISSDTVVVQNSLPVVSDVSIGPSSPKSAQNLVLNFNFSDADISETADNGQSNLSTVKWFKKNTSTGSAFIEVGDLAGESVVPSAQTARGDQWKALITPFDGLDEGTPVESPTVTIG